MTEGEIRSLAVEIVDMMHGYTVEFSNQPGVHETEYDDVERVLQRVLGAREEGPWQIAHWDPDDDDRRGGWRNWDEFFRSREKAQEIVDRRNAELDEAGFKPLLAKHQEAVAKYETALRHYDRDLGRYECFMLNAPPKPPTPPGPAPELPDPRTRPERCAAVREERRGRGEYAWMPEHYVVEPIPFEDDPS